MHSLYIPHVKFIVDNWILIVAALASGALLIWPMVSKGGLGGALSAAEAVRLINREKAVLIDVCEPPSLPPGTLQGRATCP